MNGWDWPTLLSVFGLAVALLALWAISQVIRLWVSDRRITVLERERNLLFLEARISSIQGALAAKQRYEVTVTDWGPDFTGFDGTLPRWRWVITDADHSVKHTLSGSLGTPNPPLMLGNAFTASEAHLAAMAWVERERHPLIEAVL